MELKIGISKEGLESATNELSKILADEFVLYVKTRNAHWNIEGTHFYPLHKFFAEQYDQIDEIMDDVAERIRSLGSYAPASLKQYLTQTRLEEDDFYEDKIKELLESHEMLVTNMRGSVDQLATKFYDYGTSDFITGLIEIHEKMAWMLRAHLL